jgi:hypothetical protein
MSTYPCMHVKILTCSFSQMQSAATFMNCKLTPSLIFPSHFGCQTSLVFNGLKRCTSFQRCHPTQVASTFPLVPGHIDSTHLKKESVYHRLVSSAQTVICREHGSMRDSRPNRHRGIGRTNPRKNLIQDQKAEASDQECQAKAPRSRWAIGPRGPDKYPYTKTQKPKPIKSPYAIRLIHSEKPRIKP